MPAFIRFIQQQKRKDLGMEEGDDIGDRFTITTIAHSMGGMSALMYIIKSGLDGLDHGLTKAILLSPAGIHKDVRACLRRCLNRF